MLLFSPNLLYCQRTLALNEHAFLGIPPKKAKVKCDLLLWKCRSFAGDRQEINDSLEPQMCSKCCRRCCHSFELKMSARVRPNGFEIRQIQLLLYTSINQPCNCIKFCFSLKFYLLCDFPLLAKTRNFIYEVYFTGKSRIFVTQTAHKKCADIADMFYTVWKERKSRSWSAKITYNI